MPSSTNSQQQQQPYFYLQKTHINRIFQNQNINLSGNNSGSGGKSKPVQFQAAASGEDSSLSDISFAYLHKSPLVNKINFETTVI